jgi:aryl-alcohol dehydrogenase-like predicted oxidoreductase
MAYRPSGSTGEMVSAVGVGGFRLGDSIDEALATRIVRSAHKTTLVHDATDLHPEWLGVG